LSRSPLGPVNAVFDHLLLAALLGDTQPHPVENLQALSCRYAAVQAALELRDLPGPCFKRPI